MTIGPWAVKEVSSSAAAGVTGHVVSVAGGECSATTLFVSGDAQLVSGSVDLKSSSGVAPIIHIPVLVMVNLILALTHQRV